MRKTNLKLTAVRVNGKRYWQVVVPNLGRGRKRRTFKERQEAQTYFDQAEIQIENSGRSAMTISDSLRIEAVQGAQLLKRFGKSIADAVRFYADYLTEIERSQPVAHAVKEMIAANTDDKKSVRYLRDLKYRLGRFAEDFGDRSIAEITTAEIDQWLRDLGLGPVSRNTFRRRLFTLFKFAKTRGWCRTIPAAESARVREGSDEDIGIFTPDEIAGLLSVASEETVPYLAIGAFAGLRASEIERLEWRDVNLDKGLIKVRAGKTASRRFVEIQPNLAKWLEPYRTATGSVVPQNLRVKLLADRKRAADADVLSKWVKNGLRHSFASYHLAHFEDLAKLALQMGHVGGFQILFRHYRELVSREDAARYWSIVPQLSKDTKVVTFVKAA